ncbi:MAG: hypothetical protein AAF915_04215 [Cyanobacteria bacterium P01_D01_bin.50]
MCRFRTRETGNNTQVYLFGEYLSFHKNHIQADRIFHAAGSNVERVYLDYHIANTMANFTFSL